MNKQEFEIMKKNVKKYEYVEKNIEKAEFCYNEFTDNTPHYVENKDYGYTFTTREALSKFRTSVLECIKIELDILENEMEDI